MSTIITNDITTDTVWKLAGSPYIIVPTTGSAINITATLTIQRGVIVNMASSDNYISVNTGGSLYIKGNCTSIVTINGLLEVNTTGKVNINYCIVANSPGNGIVVTGSNMDISNSIIKNNKDDGIAAINNSIVTIKNSIIDNNNQSDNFKSGIYNLNSIVAVNNSITKNHGTNGYGIYSFSNSTTTINNCTIENNSHGIYNINDSKTTINNSTIVNNDDSGINNEANLNIINCTISDNTDYGVNSSSGTVTILNSIIYQNGNDTTNNINITDGTATVMCSSVDGGYPGIGNRDVNDCNSICCCNNRYVNDCNSTCCCNNRYVNNCNSTCCCNNRYINDCNSTCCCNNRDVNDCNSTRCCNSREFNE